LNERLELADLVHDRHDLTIQQLAFRDQVQR
jgi:hypothetical protein